MAAPHFIFRCAAFAGDLAVHTFMPATCAHCRADLSFRWQQPLCASCTRGIKAVPEPFCKTCGVYLPDGGAHCRICKSPSLRRLSKCGLIRSAFLFTDELRSVVHGLKYRGRSRLAGHLAELSAPRLAAYEEFSEYDILVPVPLFEARRRERGFNQSFLLARNLARISGKSLLENALSKVRDTPAQAGLGARERQENLQAAFTADRTLVAGKNIILIDDVATTGATLEACALALKKSGARAVAGFTVAREQPRAP